MDGILVLPDTSILTILEEMGCSELHEYFTGVGLKKFLNLEVNDLKIIFPYPNVPRGVVLQFLSKYETYMSSYGLKLHKSFTNCNSSEPKGRELNSSENGEAHGSGSVDLAQLFERRFGKSCSNHSQRDNEDGVSKSDDDENKDPNYDPAKDDCFDLSSEDGDEPLSTLLSKSKHSTPRQPFRDGSNRAGSSKSTDNCDQQDASSRAGNSKSTDNCDQQDASNRAGNSKSTDNCDQQDANGSNTSMSVRPQVNPLACGSKRNMQKMADREIADLDLHKLLDDHPYTEGVLSSFKEKGRLSDIDRSTILDVLIPWLLKQTLYPTKSNYEILTEKICSVFPVDLPSIWYVAPHSEGDNNPHPRGKLPDKVRNVKERLRKQGSLPLVRRRKETATPRSSEPASSLETASIEWLKRNKEPMEQVRLHWKTSSKPRLQELLLDQNFSPHAYIKKWNNVLKLPEGYKLILDDFELLPDIDKNYECVRGKEENLLLRWEMFSSKIIKLIEAGRYRGAFTLEPKEKKEFLDLFAKADTQNDKDYVILRTIPLLCKQKGRVKFGKTTVKPSVKESTDAFILHVPDAANFDESLRKRQERHQKAEAPVQPFVLVLGEKPNAVRASYVILDGVPWKLSSVLQAVDVCLKTCFALNCGYPPEARHVWYLIQKFLYEITCVGDRSIGTVSDMLKTLEEL